MDVNLDPIHEYLAKLDADMNKEYADFVETQGRLEAFGAHEQIGEAWIKFQATIEPMQKERTAIILRLTRIKEAQPLIMTVVQ